MSLPPLPAPAERLGRLFGSHGHELYLVGGVVRDQLLTAVSVGDDIDFTTDARPDSILDLVGPLASAVWRQGERFGTIGATVDGRDVEITTYRSEAYHPDSRKPVVGFGNDLATDLGRRDFTINAMARHAVTGVLIDPFGGSQDLDQRLLRTPLDPETSFGDDPLRMLRAARFIARFDLGLDASLEVAAAALGDRLGIVSGERIFGEMQRLLALPDPRPGLRFVWRTGVLGVALGTPLAPLDTAQSALDRLALATPAEDLGLRWAALLAITGSSASETTRRLRFPSTIARDVGRLLRTDLPLPVDTPGIRRLRIEVGDVGARRTAQLRLVDGTLDDMSYATFLEALRIAAELEDLAELVPPVDGIEVQRTLGIGPGPEVGRALRSLQDHIVRFGPLSTDDAIRFLLEQRA